MENTRINWTNIKAYDKEVIQNRLNTIDNYIRGALPLYGICKNKLIETAETENVPVYELISIYNNKKTQQNINNGRFNVLNRDIVRKNFKEIVENMNIDDGPRINITKLRTFIKHIKSSYSYVYTIMKKSPQYQSLPDYCVEYIEKLYKVDKLSQKNQRKFATRFEKDLVKYIKFLGITDFRTEEEIRQDQDSKITPDILFNKPLTINVDNKDYQINWMDAKNSTFFNIPFALKSAKKQSAKYNKAFGQGALVFHYGFDKSIEIQGTLILDGSIVDNINKQ